MVKYSRQRESIKAYLMTRRDHPTADDVYTAIRRDFPNISLGTVYRNLSLLASMGEITRLSCGDGVDHFDYNTEPHYHFICKNCGCVQDIPMEFLRSIDDLAAKFFDGEIVGHSTVFYGTCSQCKNLKKAVDNDSKVC